MVFYKKTHNTQTIFPKSMALYDKPNIIASYDIYLYKQHINACHNNYYMNIAFVN